MHFQKIHVQNSTIKLQRSKFIFGLFFVSLGFPLAVYDLIWLYLAATKNSSILIKQAGQVNVLSVNSFAAQMILYCKTNLILMLCGTKNAIIYYMPFVTNHRVNYKAIRIKKLNQKELDKVEVINHVFYEPKCALRDIWEDYYLNRSI